MMKLVIALGFSHASLCYET